ncbi:hypothetical protein D9M69_710820 [compost metagenome]
MVSEDDLYRLYSFYFYLVAIRTHLRVSLWKKEYGYIIRKIDKGIPERFPKAIVEAARSKAEKALHPYWMSQLEAVLKMAKKND